MKENKLNNGSYLEFTDRIYMVSSTFEDYVKNHDVSHKNKKIRKLTTKISDMLNELYEVAGTKINNEQNQTPIHKVILRRREKSEK